MNAEEFNKKLQEINHQIEDLKTINNHIAEKIQNILEEIQSKKDNL